MSINKNRVYTSVPTQFNNQNINNCCQNFDCNCSCHIKTKNEENIEDITFNNYIDDKDNQLYDNNLPNFDISKNLNGLSKYYRNIYTKTKFELDIEKEKINSLERNKEIHIAKVKDLIKDKKILFYRK